MANLRGGILKLWKIVQVAHKRIKLQIRKGHIKMNLMADFLSSVPHITYNENLLQDIHQNEYNGNRFPARRIAG